MFSLKIESFKTCFKDFFEISLRDFSERFLRDFFSLDLGSVWFDLVMYQVQPSLMSGTGQKVYCGGGGGGWRWVLKATLVFIFGPNLKTKTLLQHRPKLNNYNITSFD